tara:strand:- start:8484 stop:9680 length:1197 start_codon:yes stop_codon:yes gene_type:complete
MKILKNIITLMEKRLREIGLNEFEIHKVLTSLPMDKIPLFIEKWNRERKSKAHENFNDNRQFNYFSNSNANPTQYMPRMLPDTTSRISSKEMNDKYQEKTQSRNDPNETLDMKSIQLFGTPPNGYTEEYLNKRYRQLALYFHPDKQNGDTSKFQMLNTCFKHLKDKIYDELKVQDTKMNESKNREVQKVSPPPNELFEKKFDPKVFNEYYSQNSFKNKQHGYGDWLKESPETVQPKNRPSESNFNASYEEHKRNLKNSPNFQNQNNFQISKYKPPEETKNYINCAVLGEESHELEDYSGKITDSNIQYSDLRLAHENTHLVYDTSNTQEKNINKEFGRAKQNLNNIPEKLSQEEKDAIYNYEQLTKEKEEERRYRSRQYDEDISEYFQKINFSNQIEF